MSKALLYDSTACIGCKQCEVACAAQNKLPYDDAIAAEQIQSEHKMTVVLTRNDKCFVPNRAATSSWYFVRSYKNQVQSTKYKDQSSKIKAQSSKYKVQSPKP